MRADRRPAADDNAPSGADPWKEPRPTNHETIVSNETRSCRAGRASEAIVNVSLRPSHAPLQRAA